MINNAQFCAKKCLMAQIHAKSTLNNKMGQIINKLSKYHSDMMQFDDFSFRTTHSMYFQHRRNSMLIMTIYFNLCIKNMLTPSSIPEQLPS